MSYRKKLIEVALPLAAINAESAREKSIRHGHPSTLHLWWARRPLAACRAVLFSSLVDDPESDPQYRKPDGSVDLELAGEKRANLFSLIEELVMWENSNNPEVIRTARAEIARCVASRLVETGELKKDTVIGGDTTAWQLVTKGHCRPKPLGLDSKAGRVRFNFDTSRLPPEDVVNKFLAEQAPPVLDPFAGGGSIPLEAQRLGLRAYASDLNPVPVLINKALIEIPPKFAGRPPVNPESRKGKLKNATWEGAKGLAEDVRYYGQWMRDEAEKRIGNLYPKVEVAAEMANGRPDLLPYVGQQLTVIAWLWARTVASPNPVCRGAHVPLVRSFCLSQKKGNEAYVEPVRAGDGRSFTFDVRVGERQSDPNRAQGTVTRKGGVCFLSGVPMPFTHIREEAKAGRMEFRLMAIAAIGARGRVFLPADATHDAVARSVGPSWKPDGEMPKKHRNFQAPVYGMNTFGDLFSPRQLLALNTLAELVTIVRSKVRSDAANTIDSEVVAAEYADAIATYLGIAIDKAADYWTTLCFWHNGAAHLKIVNTFGRQAIPMSWDYAEANPFSESSGNFYRFVSLIGEVLDICVPASGDGVVRQLDAKALSSVVNSAVVSTDPPYYDNINYADLSDFFYVWLRRSLQPIHPDLFSTVLTPKSQELIAAPHRFEGDRDKAKQFFEEGLINVFKEMRAIQSSGTPLTVFYAFKQSEAEDDESGEESHEVLTASSTSTGWETMLEGLVRSGFCICGTWPMRTELVGNLKKNISALASSIVLVCRPRPNNAALATRKEFITGLRRELPDALRNLQRGNIAPVDLAQAAIGPGMGVFTRYAKVLESDGSHMSVRTALGLINQTLDEVLAEQEGEFDGDTRWALAWFEQFGSDDGPFGDAETLSKAKNTAINGLVEAGVIQTRAGKVRLVKRDELPTDWNPATDKRLTVWEVTQHLIRRLDQQGEMGAAELVHQLGGIAEISRDLAYRLYSTCERKKWAQEALAYNSLVVAWPELTKLAMNRRTTTIQKQRELELE